MSINNMELYIKTHWDWGFVNDILPGNCAVSDTDGITDYRGHILVLETKLPNTPLPKGQEILLRNLAAKPDMTIIIVWGYPQKPERIRLLHGKHDAVYEVDTASFLGFVERWRDYALSKPAMYRAPFT